ncbi:histidine kinase [Bifidobacterium sp. ESL0790]|uniref:sensor histidine kinase n=1 Tax=Bifidobacterium sp. ESL0790 TaxID=2983233 RepID=UPI0023F7242E|nr:histidine kinase [Bifidobacterium sp. ESL0790]WEV73123.1 histidine kinase [Bifidobacterium sp. ESL0790]
MNGRYRDDAARVALLACCALLEAARQRGSFDTKAIAALLLALCCSALTQWLGNTEQTLGAKISSIAWLPSALFCIPALLLPEFLAFMPLLAFDAMTTMPNQPKTTVPWRTLLWWCWTIPLIRAYWTYQAASPSLSKIIRQTAIGPMLCAAIIILFSCLSALLGHVLSVSDAEHRTLLALQDNIRMARRRNRTQVDSLREQQEESTHVATLRERTRIAREIHDNVGHLLTRALMQTQAAGVVANAAGESNSAKQLEGIGASLDEAMTMVRRSVHDLEDDGTDFRAQIADAVHVMDSARPDFSVTLDCDVDDAPAPVARCLTAVIREALTNVVRHSDASHATVSLHDYPAFWQLAVFNTTETKPSANLGNEAGNRDLRGMGLSDIEQRVHALDGTSLCGPYRDGWRVFVSLPKEPWTDAGAEGNSDMKTNTIKNNNLSAKTDSHRNNMAGAGMNTTNTQHADMRTRANTEEETA